MSTASLTTLLQECHRERHALYDRHVRGAQAMADYEFNNTYQYVIAREEVHLRWLADAIADLGGDLPSPGEAPAVPGGRGTARETSILQDDADRQRAFLDTWRTRIDDVSHARHRSMLQVMLGEMQEHARFFELALEGRDDLLGRRMPGASTGDGVLPVRWVE